MRFKAPKDIRPTSAKVREAIFNILWSSLGSLEGLACADFFAGSGSLGITALQKGANSCLFVDNNPLSCDSVRDNLAGDIIQKAKVLQRDILKTSYPEASFDIVFADPPYKLDEEAISKVFGIVKECLKKDGLFIFEFARKRKIDFKEFDLIDRRDYGDTSVYFFKHLT